MISTRFIHSRRGFLRGCLRGAGTLAALPFLESLTATLGAAEPGGAAGGRPPLRQLIVTVVGGTVLESWKPKTVGPLTKLPSILRPLEDHKSELLVVSGLSHNGRSASGGSGGHTHCAVLHLTGAPLWQWDGKTSAIANISIDQAAAKAVGGETILPSIELGASGSEQCFSWSEAGLSIPYEPGPRQAFDRLFGGRKPTIPAWGRRNAKPVGGRTAGARPGSKGGAPASNDQLVIDLVLEEAKALKGIISRSDQRRMDEYLESVNGLEQRIVRLDQRVHDEAADARAPIARGGALKVLEPGAPELNTAWKNGDPNVRAEYFRIMSDVALLALATDTTRVVTMSIGNDGDLWPGVVTVTSEIHHHSLEHLSGNGETADPLAREGCRQIHEWYTARFAETVAKMKAIDEGGTSLLDNSMALYTSYMSHGGHGTRDYPILLAGRAQGTLKTGRHIACPLDTPVANLYLSMLDRMGAKRDRFGESTGRLADLV